MFNHKKDGASNGSLEELKALLRQFAPTPIEIPQIDSLDQHDKAALVKFIEAAQILNDLFMLQKWDKNHATFAKLQQDQSELGKARLHYYWLNKGPWSESNENKAFIPGVPLKPTGANFYPGWNNNKEEIENWMNGFSDSLKQYAQSYFTILLKTNNDFQMIPYSEFYRPYLQQAAQLLDEASNLTSNKSLQKYAKKRAQAFLSNDYYESDIAWMELDAPLDITIGPYETEEDKLFGYKASFEAYVTLRDNEATNKLAIFANYLQEIENHLPIESAYRNPNLGKSSPIRVVNVIYSSGDAANGVQTAAFNLPNDERVLEETGGKKVLLKNIQEAKFNTVLMPIAEKVLTENDLNYLTFNAFFTHILAHELSHGLGPKKIIVDGKETTVRTELKDLYGAIEEAKADVLGLFLLQYLLDQQGTGKIPANTIRINEKELYLTFFASMFRTLRFGINESHGKGMAVQFNYLLDKGAIIFDQAGKFSLVWDKLKAALTDLTHDLLMLEAHGDYQAAKNFLERFAIVSPDVNASLSQLKQIPIDIEPEFVTAKKLVPNIIASGREFEEKLSNSSSMYQSIDLSNDHHLQQNENNLQGRRFTF